QGAPACTGRVWQAGAMLTVPARLLGDAERAEVERVLDADPIAAAQVAERVGSSGLSWRVDARVFGYGSRRRIESVCWLGGNLIPVHATIAAAEAFAEAASCHPRMCSSLVGEREAVLRIWERLAAIWGPARDVRPCQPLLAIRTQPPIPPDPTVRLVRTPEINQLFPAAV